jgi:ATP-dependent helicase HrpB
VGECVALAFPDRVAKRRDSSGADWVSVGGRGFRLDPASPLAREAWLAVAEVGGTAAGARILSAAPIDQAMVERLFADAIETGTQVSFDPATGAVRASHGRTLGAIRLSGGQDSRADAGAVEAALLEGVRLHGLGLLPWSEAAESLRTRAAFARRFDPAIPELSDEALAAALDEWLPPLLSGRRRLGDVDAGALSAALEAVLGWQGRKAVDRLAPGHFETPAGSRHPIDYEA